MNNNLTNDEITKLINTKSAKEWNAVCDLIKKSRGGTYPPDWWQKVIQSGLAATVQDKWS